MYRMYTVHIQIAYDINAPFPSPPPSIFSSHSLSSLPPLHPLAHLTVIPCHASLGLDLTAPRPPFPNQGLRARLQRLSVATVGTQGSVLTRRSGAGSGLFCGSTKLHATVNLDLNGQEGPDLGHYHIACPKGPDLACDDSGVWAAPLYWHNQGSKLPYWSPPTLAPLLACMVVRHRTIAGSGNLQPHRENFGCS